MSNRRTQNWTIASTAGNATTAVLTIGDEGRVVLYGSVTLTTDATVANRYVTLQVLDSSDAVVFTIKSGAPVPASQTSQIHAVLPGDYRETSFISSTVIMPIPHVHLLMPGWKAKVTITGGVAGDAFTGRFVLASLD